MKKIYVVILVFSLLYIGCKEHSTTTPNVKIDHNLNDDSSFTSVIKQFALAYPENFSLDSNALIFYGSRPFDTSFLLQLKSGPREINGLYYEIIPAYHTELNHFVIEEKKLLFFEGYSFVLDSSYWKSIIDYAEILVADTISLNTEIACMDCEIYGLSHNNKKNIGNAIKYKPFYGYLKKQFLSNFIQRRTPIILKEK